MTVSRTFNPLPHYVGPLRQLTADSQDPQPAVKGNLERFLWNFLAERTGTNTSARCEPNFPYYSPQQICEGGQVCVGWRYGLYTSKSREPGLGWCYTASTKYVPAHSTRLACKDCDFTRAWGGTGSWEVRDDPAEWRKANGGWPEDPIWTESDWSSGVPFVRFYQQEPKAVELAVLAAGAGVTAATWLLLWAADRAFKARFKSA
mmetsp:Transcript_29393/g.82895  ORF Transcript_29393/g.82895 Transcript_29393/m.82895 type:complete len:204 (-) Transcript_29393:473-1084(-)